MNIELKAPAKINLALDILDKRADGYHLVKMIMQTIDLFDYIKLEQMDHGEIKVFCTDPFVPTDKTNLAFKAAKKFFSFAEIENKGLDIVIEKNIPVAAGLAGGSADAAATLVGLNQMYGNVFDEKKLLSLGAMIGADVPYCMQGSTMLAEGIGTVLTKIKTMPDCTILLAKPEDSISTKEAYMLNDSKNILSDNNVDNAVDAIEQGDLKQLAVSLFNRFEAVLTLPDVNAIKDLMIECGALGACMSGSGPSVFSLFDDSEIAQKGYKKLKKEYREVFLCKPVDAGVQIIK